jgi:nucleoid DNA-binding protein
VTKKEIVKQISDKLNLPQIKTKEIVQLTFDSIVETLVREGRIELRNFGVFEVKRRKPRKARNPRTGESVQVEGKNVVTFQPGKVMEDYVKNAMKVVEPKRKTRKNAKAAVVAHAALPSETHAESELPIQPDPTSDGSDSAGDLPLKPR